MIVLLTGERWGAKQGTTVEAEPFETGHHFHSEELTILVCRTGCVVKGWEGVEVPYLIGQNVVLTGKDWPEDKRGKVVEVVGYTYIYRENKWRWLPALPDGYNVYKTAEEDYSVRKVTDLSGGGRIIAIGDNETDPEAPLPFATGGYTGTEGNVVPALLDNGYVFPKSALKGINLKVLGGGASYHPNFIQVYVQSDTDKYGEQDVISYSAKRDPFTFNIANVEGDEFSTWELGNVEIGTMNDVWGYRALLDAIEARLADE